MSEHSDDGFDMWLEAESRAHAFREFVRERCPFQLFGCDWAKNEEAGYSCRTCHLACEP